RFLGLFEALLARGHFIHHTQESSRLFAQFILATRNRLERLSDGVILRLHPLGGRRDQSNRPSQQPSHHSHDGQHDAESQSSDDRGSYGQGSGRSQDQSLGYI